jgi:hypothetical protein
MIQIARSIALAALIAPGLTPLAMAQANAPQTNAYQASGLQPAAAQTGTSQAAAPVLTYRAEGTWSGAAKCTPQAVLCEDRQIVIRVTKDPAPDPKLYDVDFTTVTGGTETPENHLVMSFSDDHHVLVAHFIDEHKRQDAYFLAVRGDTIHGVLLVNGRVIERSVDLTRTADTATPLPWASAASTSPSSSAQ